MKYLIRLSLLSGLASGVLLGTATAEEKVDFEKQIYPILEKKCVDCHRKTYKNERGRLAKPKSGLRLDGAKFYKEGGDYQEDEGKKVIVPGKSAESTLYVFTTLPEDDDWFMPPKDDPLTDDEKKLLAKWIDEGAEFGDWKGDEGEFEEEPKE